MNPREYYHLKTAQITEADVRLVAAGGTNDFENLQILCKRCNCRKQARYEE